MALIGVRQSARLVIYSSLASVAAVAIGHPAIAESPVMLQPLSSLQQQPELLAQASQPASPEAIPNGSEPTVSGEPEREIEFTSPTFSIGVQGEGGQGDGTQNNVGQAAAGQTDPAQEPLEAGTQRNTDGSEAATDEALAAQHEWAEFSVEDSDEAIARYGCDDLYCINALREQRGLPPLQLVWDAQNSNASPQ